jgi:exosortase A
MAPTLSRGAGVVTSGDDRMHWSFVVTMVGLALAAVIAIHWSTAVGVVRVWSDSDTYNFCFLVAPVSLYLIWERRHQIAGLRARPMPLALPLLVLTSLAWLLSDVADVSMGRHVALMGSMQIVLLSVLGWRVYRALLFPLLYLWLMVPAADIFLPSLQAMTTVATVAGLNLLGIPSTWEGILIVADGATYRIVEQCASLDFLLGSLAFSLVYGHLLYRRIQRRLAFVAIACGAAVTANLFRTTSIIYLTDVSDGRIDLAAEHLTYGWVIFLVTTVGLMLAGLRYREDVEPITIVAPPSSEMSEARLGLGLTAAVAVVVAAAAPAYAAFTAPNLEIPAAVAISEPPADAPWQVTHADGQWRPAFPGADLTMARRYVANGRGVDLFLAYYWRQRPGAELIAWNNIIEGVDKDEDEEETWRLLKNESRQVVVEGRALEITETLLLDKPVRRIVWHWHWIDGAFSSDRLEAKIVHAKTRLLSGEPRSAFVAVSVEQSGTMDEARALLQALVGEALAVTPCLEGAGPEPAC